MNLLYENNLILIEKIACNILQVVQNMEINESSIAILFFLNLKNTLFLEILVIAGLYRSINVNLYRSFPC